MSLDAYSPPQIAERVEAFGVAKANSPWLRTLMLGILAGGFIGLGGLYFTVVTTDDSTWHLLAGGVVFSTGYMLAILAGAEVFTSNNLLAMAWASRRLTSWQLLRNWTLVLAANAVGAVGLAVVFVFSGLPDAQDGAVRARAIDLAAEHASLPLVHAFLLGVLGNLFVCLAIWVSLAGRSVTDRVVGSILPLSALGAIGLEHVAASLYFVPRGLLLSWIDSTAAADMPEISPVGALTSTVAVTAGNIVGGSLMVALVYYVTYMRTAHHGTSRDTLA
ncbi:formate/nitrite transporter family protein [Lipingzhangella sp. LS1_29]|uniref:Formate/nitrite transporter family protein n=1 Tax=Lipingzhangella rawalii TaxID=2055835 RepID=A0ABU2HDF9_9ACTN|nr:formate/nitrite transporter family protein [Lipingzhangella rawalii]MDS1272599.1 formate/nitrite transporter family protein [Lipingzhangella rawalii]